MIDIEPMTSDWFEEMDRIDIEAWSNWATQQFGQAMEFPTKRPVYGTYLDGDPEGGFVAVDRDSGTPVGYIFTRTLGKIGFFGPFGVVPQHQASHVGKRLVNATVEYMERMGCTTVGLETMPETAYNLGLYTKLGFKLETLTLRLHKELGEGASELPPQVESVPEPGDALLERVRLISGTLEEGLDQSKEVALLRRHPIGTCLTWSPQDEVEGFALCYIFPDTVGLYPPVDAQNLRVRILGMHADTCGQKDLEPFMQGVEAWARSQGRTHITVPVYAGYDASLHTLFGMGYRVHDRFPSLVKLTRDPYRLPRPEAVSLCEWAG